MFNSKRIKELEKENRELKEILEHSYIRNAKGQFEKYNK